ncbi:MAG: hypothetical protein A2Y34_02835 [Spirochaetes bacterium GWC1_27_15]|nr:MAG: hypothetical protein A2Z98_05720 [Spirochaetes bacterium GWB1_27_13]OHD28014.1 MAG: hypothetical protein A2Y34_02835 [Spirochaetes bacterium GWC1_27_15]
MKNKFLLFMFLIMIISSLFGEDKLRIITDDWQPYEFEDNKQVVGFSTELILATFNDMGISIENIEIWPWLRGETLILDGKIDALYSGLKNKKREEMCYYPEEHLIDSVWLVYIRKEDEGRLKYDSYKDMDGKKVGVVRNYTYTEEFWDYINKTNNYEEVVRDKDNFNNLINKKVDYIVAESRTAKVIIEKLNATNKVISLKKIIKADNLYILFSKKRVNKKLVDLFSEHLKKIKKTDLYLKIYKKYF